MKVNLKTIEKLAGFELPSIDELAERVNAQLGGIEEIIDLGAKYGGARIVRVVECIKHPDADRLSVTKIDDGGAAADVPRDENGLVQVVCGAPNVHADMWAVWLPPKSTVPASFDDDEPFVLSARPLRGVLSQGMLAAGDELGLNDDHDGIIEITERDVPSGVELKPGARFAEVFGLDGHVLDIENKMFTHRPDCFGQLGVAREIAGIFGRKFTSPDWYKVAQEFAPGDSSLELVVKNEAPDKVPRLMAVAIKNVTVQPSPLWLQCELVAMGGKPINNIVDATNYMMFMTAQPTHAYDYDKLRGHALGARLAQSGETVTLLNGKTYELDTDDIVIADGEGVIGLAGIMGGGNSEVSNETKNIVLECANFDMYALRKTAMRHGIFTDALTRFNKGQSPLQNAPVLRQLMGMVGGEQASEVFDRCDDSIFVRKPICGKAITPTFIFERLGMRPDNAEIKRLLENVEMKVEEHTLYSNDSMEKPDFGDIREGHDINEEEDALYIKPPFWRTDIDEPEDIVEEVGRLYGFDKLPRELPRRSAKPAPKNSRREVKRKIRQSLSKAGANEVLTYSFVHENILKKAEQDVGQAFKLSNALSPDLQYYRLTVLPSLLDKVHTNIKAGHDEFALFEMGKGHDKQLPSSDGEKLPGENHFTDLVYAAKKPGKGAPFYRVRRIVEQLGRDFGTKFLFTPINEKSAGVLNSSFHASIVAPFDSERSAVVMTLDRKCIGVVGELKQSVIKNFKLPSYVAAATLETAMFEEILAVGYRSYHPLSRYPSTSRDITFKTDADISFGVISAEVDRIAGEITRQDGYSSVHISIAPRGVYRSTPDDPQKSTTFRVTFTDYAQTLNSNEISSIVENWFVKGLQEYCGAELV